MRNTTQWPFATRGIGLGRKRAGGDGERAMRKELSETGEGFWVERVRIMMCALNMYYVLYVSD